MKNQHKTHRQGICLWLILVTGLLSHAFPAWAEDGIFKTNEPVKLGILPHLSSNLLVKKYNSLVTYLEFRLRRKVILKTAPDFKTYIQRAAKNEYDIYVTAPHFALYHQQGQKHTMLARFSYELYGVLAVEKASSIVSIGDLKNKVFATPDPLAVITMLGELELQRHGIQLEKEITFKRTTSHNKALLSVVNHLADAAIVGRPMYKMIAEKQNKPLRILGVTESIPGQFILASNNVSAQDAILISEYLLDFQELGYGEDFFRGLPYKGVVTVSKRDIERLQPMLELLKQRLN